MERKLTLRKLASELDLSFSTLSRLERLTSAKVNFGTQWAVSKWIGDPDINGATVAKYPNALTAIKAVLKRDKVLDAEARDALYKFMEVAYNESVGHVP